MKVGSIYLLLLLGSCLTILSSAFSLQKTQQRRRFNRLHRYSSSMWLFGSNNKDTSDNRVRSVEVTINGKPVKATLNQKVSQVAAAARVPIQYSCRKGDCATCSISMNGRIVKACQEKIPNGKTVIQTL